MGTVTCQSPCYGYSDAEPVKQEGCWEESKCSPRVASSRTVFWDFSHIVPQTSPLALSDEHDFHQSPGATPWRLKNRPSLLPLVSSLPKYVCSATQQTSPSHCLNSHLKALEHSPGPPLTLPGPCGAFVLSFVHVQCSGRPPMASLLFLPCLAVCTVDGC